MKTLCTQTERCSGQGIPGQGDGCLGCPFLCRISDPIEVEDVDWRERAETWQMHAMAWHMTAMEFAEAFLNMAAAFEELAERCTTAEIQRDFYDGAYQNLLRMAREELALGDVQDDEITVRPHKRHRPKRRQRLFDANEVVGILPEAAQDAPCFRGGASPASDPDPTEPYAQPQGQPEAFRDGVTLWYCERCDQVVEHYPCKHCGFEGQPPSYKCGTCFDMGMPSMPCPDCGADLMHPPTGLAVCTWEPERWRGVV